MQDKTKKQKKDKKIKVQDLKPKKDAKGGGPHYTTGGAGLHGLH
ncbi:MAG TPA: hypothetical protein VGI41_08520 [Candidatus Udaeobacter sp.]|jgi:hypothetical protein